MENKVGTFHFPSDTQEFEPYPTLGENHFYWFKPYMQTVFKNQSKRLVKDLALHKKLVKVFNSKNDLNEMKDVINEMARNGFKGPKTYFNPNKLFYEFLIEWKQTSLTQINSEMLRHFLSEELEEYSYTYKKNIFVAVKNFILYIEDHNVIKATGDSFVFKLHRNITKVLGRETKAIAYLSPYDEYYSFLNAVDEVNWQENTRNRNRLMMKILLITGIRVGELTSIKLKDIHIDEKRNAVKIVIIGKGNKKRETSIAYDKIKDELDSLLLNTLNKEQYLFETNSGKAINDRYLRNIIIRVLDEANIPLKEKNSSHMLRHSAATWLCAVGEFDIAKLQIYMGHEDIKTTKKYIHLSSEVVKSISREANEILGKAMEDFNNSN